MKRPTHPLILLLVLALSAPLAGCDRTASLSEQEHIQRAKDFEDKGDIKGSIIELKNAIQKNPDSREARLLLGQVYLKAGQGAEAEKELVQAANLGVNRESIKTSLGEALLLMGEYKRVLDEIQPGEQSSKSNRARIYQIRADALLKQGKVQDACNLYQQALDTDPSHPQIYWGLAQCAVANREPAKARNWLDEALKLGTHRARTWVFIGDLEQLNQNPKAALAAYDQALKSEPQHVEALRNRAILNLALGNLDAAKADIDQVARHAPKSLAAHYLKALLDFEQKRYAEARQGLQEVFKITSDHLPSVLLAGATDYALASYQQAETHLARYLSRHPGHAYARRLLAATQIQLGLADKALEALAPLLMPDTRDVQALVLASEAYRLKREPGKATQLLSRATAIDPANATLQAQLGFNHLAAGESELAIAELSRASALDSKQQRADLLLVMTHLERKEFDKALAAVDTLEKKTKPSAATHTMRGNAFFGKKDFASARASFERAVSLDPTFYPAAASLAELDMRDGNVAAAQKRFETLLKHDTHNVAAMMALAGLAQRDRREQAYVEWLERAMKAQPKAIPPRAALVNHLLGKNASHKALALANETLRDNPDDPAALDLLGSVQMAMKDYPGATSTYTRLTQLASQSANAWVRLAVAQMANKRPTEARATLQKALALRPDHEAGLSALIQLDVQSGRPDQALLSARGYQKTYPQSPYGYEREGDVHMSQKRYAEAAKAYEQALAKGAGSAQFIKFHRASVQAGIPSADRSLEQWLARHPKDAVVRFYAAEQHAAAGRDQAAIAAYQALLAQTPDSPPALNNLAMLYLKLGDSRARPTAEQAHKLDPGNPAIRDTLGWILVQEGQPAKGLALIDQALAGLPGNPTVRYHRAVALARTGEKSRARQELETLLRDTPGFPEAAAAREALDRL